MHARTQIRNAVVAALDGAIDGVGSNVFNAPAIALDEDQQPALAVYTNEETRLESDSGRDYASSQRRRLVVSVQVYVKHNNEAAERLDAIAAQVETVLYSDPVLPNLVTDLEYEGTTITQENQADMEMVAAVLTFSVDYFVDEDDPETITE